MSDIKFMGLLVALVLVVVIAVASVLGKLRSDAYERVQTTCIKEDGSVIPTSSGVICIHLRRAN